MDEGLLDDLLECSVCLERLDTSSRVLPCQHTFCIKCLKEIVQSHKELRCPECRVLVEVRLEDLPPNVLLMRILEGMRFRPNPPHQTPLHHTPSHQTPSHHTPSHQTPSHHTPSHQTPLHHTPSHQTPSHHNPAPLIQTSVPQNTPLLQTNNHQIHHPASHQMPLHQTQSHQNLSLQIQSHQNLAHQNPSHQTQSHLNPSHQNPSHQNPPHLIPSHQNPSHQTPSHQNPSHQTPSHQNPSHQTPSHQNSSNQAPSQQPVSNQPVSQPIQVGALPHARALYEFNSKHPGDLSFKTGDLIILQSRIDAYWYFGESGSKQGVFPISFAKVVVPLPFNGSPQCKALYDFHMAPPDEEGCLAFQKGAMISVIRRVDENWAEGRLQERIGIFPIAFVEMNAPARALMKLSVNLQSTPTDPTATHRTEQIHNSYRQAVADSSSSSTPDSSGSPSSVSASSSGSTPGSPASPARPYCSVALRPSQPEHAPLIQPPVTHQKTPVALGSQTSEASLVPNVSGRQLVAQGPPYSSSGYTLMSSCQAPHPREKRHSLTTTQGVILNTALNRLSAEINRPVVVSQEGESGRRRERDKRRARSAERPLPAAYVALYPYKPQKTDELELRKGGLYMVLERCQDGWYKGCSNRTNKCGVFPGNYVTPARHPTPSTAEHKVGPGSPSIAGPSREGGAPPDLPPRSASPILNCSAPVSRSTGTPKAAQSPISPATATKSAEKSKEKDKEKSRAEKAPSSMSLMKRLAAMKRSKSPPPTSGGADNPTFQDTPPHPVHIRGGEVVWTGGGHRKSQSLDAGRERFRCVTPYPPNSEYELELRVDDVVLVHRKWGDGWYKGTLERTGRTGLFPASFVEASN